MSSLWLPQLVTQRVQMSFISSYTLKFLAKISNYCNWLFFYHIIEWWNIAITDSNHICDTKQKHFKTCIGLNVLLMLQPLTFISILFPSCLRHLTHAKGNFCWNLKRLCFHSVITSGSLKNMNIILGYSTIENKASDTKNV